MHETIRELRRRLGVSQQVFATRLGISIRALTNYEAEDSRFPPIDVRLKLWAIAARAGINDLAEDFKDDFSSVLPWDEILDDGPETADWTYIEEENKRRVILSLRIESTKTPRSKTAPS